MPSPFLSFRIHLMALHFILFVLTCEDEIVHLLCFFLEHVSHVLLS